jgi:hypothetical protein
MKTTIELAREAGDDWDSTLSTDKEFLRRFEALIRADEREQGQKWFEAVTAQHKQEILAEREACAKVCESEAEMFKSCAYGANDGRYDWKEDGARECAAAIRARGETK